MFRICVGFVSFILGVTLTIKLLFMSSEIGSNIMDIVLPIVFLLLSIWMFVPYIEKEK